MNPDQNNSDGTKRSVDQHNRDTDRTVHTVEDPADSGSGGCGPVGHDWEPVSVGGDRETDPMTVSYMECVRCEERKEVEDGDLYGYAGAYQPPEGVSVRDE